MTHPQMPCLGNIPRSPSAAADRAHLPAAQALTHESAPSADQGNLDTELPATGQWLSRPDSAICSPFVTDWSVLSSRSVIGRGAKSAPGEPHSRPGASLGEVWIPGAS